MVQLRRLAGDQLSAFGEETGKISRECRLAMESAQATVCVQQPHVGSE